MLKAGSTNTALSSRLFALWTSLPTLTHQSKSLQYCLFHVSQLQYLLILFWIQTYFTLSDDKEALTHYVVEATKVCNLRDMLMEADKSWLYSFLLIFMWVYLLGLAASFTLFRAKDKTMNYLKPSIRSTVIQFLLQIHFSCVFWLINMVISASWSGSNHHRNMIFERKVPQGLIILINCLALVLNYLISGISALFCFYPFKNQNILGSHSSSSQFTTFICKAVLTPFIMTYQDDNLGIQIILAAVVLVFSAIKLVQSMRSVEYYSYSMSKAILTWNIAGLWIALINAFFLILTDNLEEKKVKALFYISVILLPVVIKFKVQDFERRVGYYLTVDVNRLKSQQEILKKIQALDMLGENMKKGILKSAFADLPEIYFLGELSEHKKQCQDSDCLCSYVASPESQAPVNCRELVERYLYKRTLGILNEAASRIQPNHDLKLAISNIIINNEDKLATLALTHLGGINEENADIFTKINKRLLLNLLQEKVDIHFEDSKNDSLNIRKLLDFQADKTCFVEHLIKSTNNYIEFWTYFKHLRLQLASLAHKSSKIDHLAEKIDYLWERFGSRYPEFQSLLYEPYAIYLRLISNMPNRATKIMKQFAFKSIAFKYKTKHLKTINQENMYLSDTITIYVSMTRGKLGNIQHITPNIQGILGYTQKELTNQNISCFFTPFFAQQHFQILEKHLEEKRTFRGNNYLHTKGFIRTKGGFIRPCITYVTLSPYLQGELTYIAAIRTFENDFDQINFTPTGLIDSYTFGISQELNLSTNHQQLIRITDICPDMEPTVRRKSKRFKWSTILHSVNDKLSFKKSNQTDETPISATKDSPVSPDMESPFQEDALLEETDWQNIDFLQLNPSYEGAKKTFQVKVVKQDYMKRKFFAMMIKPNIGTRRGDGSAPMVEEFRHVVKEKELSDHGNDSEIFEIPEESYTLRQTINALSPRLSTSPLLTQTPRMFARPPALNLFDFHHVNNPENQSPTIQDSNFLQNHSFLQSRNDSSSPRLHLLVKRTPEVVVVKKHLKIEAVKEVEPQRDSELSHFEEDENIRMKMKDDFGTTSLASSKHAKSKIEFATYAIPSNPILRALKYIVYAFLFLCIAFIVSFILKEQSNLQVVKGNIDILRYCNIRLTRIIGIKRGINYFPMYQQGIITEKRYLIYGVANFLTNTITATLTAEQELSSANNLLRSALNQTQPDLQKNFYNTLVPLKLNNTGSLLPDYLYRNTFDAVIEIMVRAIKISTMQLEEFKNPVDEVSFIFENGFNDLLLTSENINSLMVQDSDSRFHEMNKQNLAELLAVIVIGILLLGSLARRQLDAIKGRNRIIDMFLRIEEKQVDQTLSEVKFFKRIWDCLIARSMSLERIMLQHTANQAIIEIKIIKNKVLESEGEMQRQEVSIIVSSWCLD